MAKKRSSLPWPAWILGTVFLLYGLASGFDNVMSLSQREAYYRASGMTAQQIAHFSAVPTWATVAWTTGVWASLLGAIALLLRRKLAGPLFLVSVAGNLLYIVHSFALSAGREAMGVLWPMPFVITALTLGVALYCRRLTKMGVLA